MKLAIFDKDGTLTTPASDAEFVQHPEDQILLPGVSEGVAAMAADGWTIAIASNQGGVAAGYKSLDDAVKEMRYCLNLLPQIQSAYFCPSDYRPWWKTLFKSMGLFHSQCIKVDAETISTYTEAPIDEDATLAGFKKLDYRKPGSLMLYLAMEQASSWDSSASFPCHILFIGDRPEDEQAAANAGVEFIWADEWRAQYV